MEAMLNNPPECLTLYEVKYLTIGRFVKPLMFMIPAI